ncbi:MAG: hypothetical protein N2441_01900 [Rhodocyclaceae bacterium]|nr:hypothetical protein [Rhodocyclaceae bacterium]
MRLADLPDQLLASRPHLFSPYVVKVSRDDWAFCEALIAAIESLLSKAPFCAEEQAGAENDPASGVFFAYDFHLTPAGPRLIEINTNAGGALLSALREEREDVLADFVAMFRAEMGERSLRALAIVDEAPSTQYLYPEFLAFQRLFGEAGILAVICDPMELLLCHGGLWHEDTRLDLVYNRLTDFYLQRDAHCIVREAWKSGAAVVTPNPTHYARYADKRRLIALTDEAWLIAQGVPESSRRLLLSGIPRCEKVSLERAEEFWRHRREYFFKPATGYGSRGAYRGEKITRRVFAEILANDYLAQRYAPPSTMSTPDGEMKVDLRLIVFRGRIQYGFARLYQGQTTNFRTVGGGFAKVVVT